MPHTCPPGQVWCDGSSSCITPPAPPGPCANLCFWSEVACAWKCVTAVCPAGWTWSDTECRCKWVGAGTDFTDCGCCSWQQPAASVYIQNFIAYPGTGYPPGVDPSTYDSDFASWTGSSGRPEICDACPTTYDIHSHYVFSGTHSSEATAAKCCYASDWQYFPLGYNSFNPSLGDFWANTGAGTGSRWCCPSKLGSESWPDCSHPPVCPPPLTWDPVLQRCDHGACPPGMCWCDSLAGCIDCPDPPCKTALHCTWDHAACRWVCDSPPDCGPNSAWDESICRCSGGGAWNLQDPLTGYHVAAPAVGSGIRYQRADATLPPFDQDAQATTDLRDVRPKMIVDWRRTGIMLIDRGGDVVEVRSDDDGASWREAGTVFSGGQYGFPVIHPLTGVVVRAAVVPDGSGGYVIHGTLQFPGDPVPSDPFTFQLGDGVGGLSDLAVEAQGFGVAPAQDGPMRWLLVAVPAGGTEYQHYQSFDEGVTWALIS